VRLDELRRLDLRVAADFTDHQHRFGAGIGFEQLQEFDVMGADDRVAADADGGGLPHLQVGELPHRFIGQCAALADQSDLARSVNVARHNADLGDAGGDDPRAVRADEAGP